VQQPSGKARPEGATPPWVTWKNQSGSLEGCKRRAMKVGFATTISIAKSLLQPSRLQFLTHSNPGRCPRLLHF